VESSATTVDDIIEELSEASFTERRDRLIDTDQLASMEQKKCSGYF
jgi:sulfate adenylyltransferase subunit 2